MGRCVQLKQIAPILRMFKDLLLQPTDNNFYGYHFTRLFTRISIYGRTLLLVPYECTAYLYVTTYEYHLFLGFRIVR